MEDQNSVKGQTFTLMIFGGIVVLCSIFFILGMLVGRTQGLKLATVAAAEAAAKANPPKLPSVEERPELSFYDDVDKKKPAVLESPSRLEPKSVPPTQSVLSPPKVEPPPAPAPVNTLSIQVAAFKKSADAEKQVAELKKKGFRAITLGPAPRDSNPLYRVQIQVANMMQAELKKKELEAAGYKPILKQ